jgi:enoyl-CoA hydratase
VGLRVERPAPGTVVLTLSRPQALNALDAGLMAELYAAADELDRTPSDRVVVLTGDGTGFCAGQDIKNYGDSMPSAEQGPAALLAFQQYMSRIVVRLRELSQPVIAAVNGVAVGGGMALACAADIRIAAPEARFGTGAVRLGLSGCEMGLSYHLPRLTSMGSAAELMLTGQLIDAAEALRIGLVNRVVDRSELLGTARDLAAAIIANSPIGVRMTKRAMWANVDEADLERAIDREDRTQVTAFLSRDAQEAQAALRQRRPPEFLDR